MSVSSQAEHEALVAGAGLKRVVARLVDALLDVGGLLVVADQHGAAAVVDAVFGIVVADVLEGVAGDANVVDKGACRDFAREDDESRRAERFSRDAAIGILLENRIEHGVRDLVCHLVRMAFTHGLGSEEIAATHLLLQKVGNERLRNWSKEGMRSTL